jgi:hypothetical protein
VVATLKSTLSRLGTHTGSLLILLSAALASSGRIVRGISCGHDYDFHFVSWMEVQRNWSQGVLYPHWAQSPNWGAGEARFIFYPPLTWMLGAVLGYMMNWDWVPATIQFLSLAGAGLATRALARQFLPARNATLAGVIATATPYALFTGYERTAFSELAAAVWIPLLLLFALRSQKNSAFPLAVVLAATWLTNAPAGVMATYLLAFTALTAAILLRQWWPLLRVSGATVLGLGMAAFYLVPAAWEQRWIAIQQAVDVGMRVSDSWLFARHASPDLELHDQVLRVASAIVVFTCSFAAGGVAICVLRHKLPRSMRHFWVPLALLVPILFALQLPFSDPVWNALPKLQFLQFPWRWLTVLATPYAIFLAAATSLEGRRARTWGSLFWTAALLTIVGFGMLSFFQFCDQEDFPGNQIQVFQAGTGVDGTDEYAPLGSDNSIVASNLPDACLVSDPTQELGEGDSNPEAETAPVWFPEQGSCDQTFSASLWQTEHKTFDIDSDHDGYLVLRLRRYPAWKITINGKVLDQKAEGFVFRQDGLLALPVSNGHSKIDIRWAITPDLLWGRGISVASLLCLISIWIILRRRRLVARGEAR